MCVAMSSKQRNLDSWHMNNKTTIHVCVCMCSYVHEGGDVCKRPNLYIFSQIILEKKWEAHDVATGT